MSLARVLVIVNPASNHGETGDLVTAAAELLDGRFEHDIVVTESPSHAKSLAENATGFETIIAMGGDGTVHEVLNGLMQHTRETRPVLTVIPTGSGNDYARTLGISTDMAEAVDQIAAGEVREIDVGTCNEFYFANTLAIGLDAQVTARAVELKADTDRSGLLLYLTALFHVLFKEFKSYDVRISFDDGPETETSMLLIAFTHGPTYGGGFHITPAAVSDDGLMDVCRIDAMPLWQALWRVPFIIPGKHEWMKPVHTARHRRVRLEADRPIPCQADGEVVRDDRYDIGVLHRELRVLVPRTAHG